MRATGELLRDEREPKSAPSGVSSAENHTAPQYLEEARVITASSLIINICFPIVSESNAVGQITIDESDHWFHHEILWRIPIGLIVCSHVVSASEFFQAFEKQQNPLDRGDFL
jgi:hypothetical protein